jgi:hypothetical protein
MSGRQDSNLRPVGPEPGLGFPDGVSPSQKLSDSLDISDPSHTGRPPYPTPYEAEHAPDRASVGCEKPGLVFPETLMTIRDVAARLGVCRGDRVPPGGPWRPSPRPHRRGRARPPQ